MPWQAAFVALGSNQRDPVHQVRGALRELDALPQTRLRVASTLYRSDPLGPPDQPPYVNAVARVETGLGPDDLLRALQALERSHGRVPGPRWGPRTLDLDLLVYGTWTSPDPAITVPHPRLHERAFVLYPLHEIAPALAVPGLGPVADLLRRCPAFGIARLDDVSE